MTTNELPDGFPLTEIAKAVASSGYPVQLRVAEQLRQHFDVVEEWGFEAEEGVYRRLDVFGVKTLSEAEDVETSCRLLVECKRSKYPLLLFKKVTAAIPHFLRVTGIHYPVITLTQDRYAPAAPDSVFGPAVLHGGETSIERRVPAAVCLGLHQLDFIAAGPPAVPVIARVEHRGGGGGTEAPKVMSGDWPYRKVVLPMLQAIDFADNRFRLSKKQDPIFPSLVHALCVIDAPMVLAAGPEEPLQLELTDWVRVERHETEASPSHDRLYGIDFVHIDFLADYVEQHFLPFLEQVAEIFERRATLLRSGKGRIKEPYGDNRTLDWDSFDPDGITPL